MQMAFLRNNPALQMKGKSVQVLPMTALHARTARLEFQVVILGVVTKMNAAEMQFSLDVIHVTEAMASDKHSAGRGR